MYHLHQRSRTLHISHTAYLYISYDSHRFHLTKRYKIKSSVLWVHYPLQPLPLYRPTNIRMLLLNREVPASNLNPGYGYRNRGLQRFCSLPACRFWDSTSQYATVASLHILSCSPFGAMPYELLTPYSDAPRPGFGRTKSKQARIFRRVFCSAKWNLHFRVAVMTYECGRVTRKLQFLKNKVMNGLFTAFRTNCSGRHLYTQPLVCGNRSLAENIFLYNGNPLQHGERDSRSSLQSRCNCQYNCQYCVLPVTRCEYRIISRRSRNLSSFFIQLIYLFVFSLSHPPSFFPCAFILFASA